MLPSRWEEEIHTSFVIHSLNTLLQKLKRRKEDGVDGARPRHRHAQAAVHVAAEGLDDDAWHFFALGVHERVALVDALGRVDGVFRGGVGCL
jgi:hypothetical protein